MLGGLIRRKQQAKQPIEVKDDVRVVGRVDLDINSATWAWVIDWVKRELQALREKNDNSDLAEIKTAEIRGRIKMLKQILAIPDDRKKGLLNMK